MGLLLFCQTVHVIVEKHRREKFTRLFIFRVLHCGIINVAMCCEMCCLLYIMFFLTLRKSFPVLAILAIREYMGTILEIMCFDDHVSLAYSCSKSISNKLSGSIFVLLCHRLSFVIETTRFLQSATLNDSAQIAFKNTETLAHTVAADSFPCAWYCAQVIWVIFERCRLL